MPHTSANLTIPHWHYACTGCGRCCRRWHVALTPRDEARLQELPWTTADRISAQTRTRILGHPYLAHRPSGACVYLDEATDRCRIHSRFGMAAKPLGCRVYPFNISSTLPGKYSMICRFDCPAVRAGVGPSVTESRATIERQLADMDLSRAGGAGPPARAFLAGAVLERLTDELTRRLCVTDHEICTRLVAGAVAVQRLERLGSGFLNEIDADEILPSLFERVNADAAALPDHDPGVFSRLAFIALLCGYLRRDEEMIGAGLGARFRRTGALAGMLLWRGNPRRLGEEHPDAAFFAGRLLRRPMHLETPDALRLYVDFLRLRLTSRQFFGACNYGLDVFAGLRSLLLTFPLTVAVAKWTALARDRTTCCVRAGDVSDALGAVDHSFGRSAYLNLGLMRRLADCLAAPASYAALVRGLTRPEQPLDSGHANDHVPSAPSTR